MNFDLSQLDKKLKGGKAAPAKASKFAPRLLAKASAIVDIKSSSCSADERRATSLASSGGSAAAW